MDPTPDDPPSHDETMIESSIVEIPPSYTQSPRPPRRIRWGRILASLLLAVVSVAVGAFVLYQRRLAEQEQVFLASGEAILAQGGDPDPALAEFAKLPPALRSRVSVQSLQERLLAENMRLLLRAKAEGLAEMAFHEPNSADRLKRLARAEGLDPDNQRIPAFKAHLQLEVWASRGTPPNREAWLELFRSLQPAKAPEAVLLVARARVHLAQAESSSRSRALQDLAQAAKAAQSNLPSGEGGVASAPGWVLYAEGWRALLLHKHDAALPFLETLLERPSPSLSRDPLLGALASYRRAQVRWALGDSAGAAEDLETSRMRDPLAEAPEAFAVWLKSQSPDRSPEALAEARSLSERWPRSGVALAARAELEGPPGLPRAERALSLEPNSDLVHLTLAQALRYREPARALEHARQAVLWGRSLRAYLLRGELALEARDLESVAKDLRAASDLAPNHQEVSALSGRLEIARDNPKEALLIGRGLLMEENESLVGHILVAEALGALGRWAGSGKRAARALGQDAGNPRALLARARALTETKQSVLALADLRQLQPKSLRGQFGAEVAYLEGRCHGELGEVPRALAAYKRFLQLTYRGDRRRRLAKRYQEAKAPR